MLRPGGFAIDARPAVEYRPRLAIRQRNGSRVAGDILRDPDPGIVAARRAVRELVREGRFVVVSRARRRWTARYPDLKDLRWLERVNDSWTITAELWTRVRAAWKDHVGPQPVEIARAYSLTILRKQRRRARG